MPRRFTDDAIVLRSFNVGEADRFCLLLTRLHGRIAARVHGARRTTSKRGGLLPLHRCSVVLEERSHGTIVTSSAGVHSFPALHGSTDAFCAAVCGVELILKLTHEGVPLPEVFDTTASFLESIPQHPPALLLPVFSCKILSLLGLFPHVDDALSAPGDVSFSPMTCAFSPSSDALHAVRLSLGTIQLLRKLSTIPLSSLPLVDPPVVQELEAILYGVLGSQLGSELASVPVSRSISSFVLPSCHVRGRAS